MRKAPILLLGLLLIVGCSDSSLNGPPVPISGKVSLKGTPVSGAIIQFRPIVKGGQPGEGRTDASGNYQITNYSGTPGVAPGEYKVIISLMKGPDGKEIPADKSPMSSGGSEALPKIYSKDEYTILKATVPATGPVTIDFPLTGQGGAMGAAMPGKK